MRELRGRSVRRCRNVPGGNQPVADWRRHGDGEPVGIVERLVVFPKPLDTAHDRFDTVRSQRTWPHMWRSKREAASPLVNPEEQTRVASLGNDVGIAVAIDVGNDESDDEIVCAQIQGTACPGKPQREHSRAAADRNPIMDAVAVEICPQRFGSSGGWDNEREERAKRNRRVSAYARHRGVEHGVAFQERGRPQTRRYDARFGLMKMGNAVSGSASCADSNRG
jgi:hypothetical protein